MDAWPLIAIASAVLVTAAGVWFGQVYHLRTIDSGVLYRTGNRGMREFANVVRRTRPRTVIPLIDDAELADPAKPQFSKEMAWLKDRGIAVERIAIPLGGWPSRQDVARFLAIVSDPDRRPVLVHCAQGVRRTGMLVAAYEMTGLGKTAQETKQRLEAFGHSRRTVKDIETFIDGYNPASGQVPEGLPVGRE